MEARPKGNSWKIDTGTQAELPVKRGAAGRASPADRTRVSPAGVTCKVRRRRAFAIDRLGIASLFTVTLNGQGQATYRFSPGATNPATAHQFTIYQHFVSVPVPIGAATTPTSMLHPPVVEVIGK